ncbi:MAG TPA: hypothetical protein VF921_00060 [Vicinamibacterales bacterium]
MKTLTALCGLTTWLLTAQAVSTPAGSPAAEGFGAGTPGGRGGRAIAVTTLADAGPGSLRAAVTAAGPRTIGQGHRFAEGCRRLAGLPGNG